MDWAQLQCGRMCNFGHPFSTFKMVRRLARNSLNSLGPRSWRKAAGNKCMLVYGQLQFKDIVYYPCEWRAQAAMASPCQPHSMHIKSQPYPACTGPGLSTDALRRLKLTGEKTWARIWVKETLLVVICLFQILAREWLHSWKGYKFLFYYLFLIRNSQQ